MEVNKPRLGKDQVSRAESSGEFEKQNIPTNESIMNAKVPESDFVQDVGKLLNESSRVENNMSVTANVVQHANLLRSVAEFNSDNYMMMRKATIGNSIQIEGMELDAISTTEIRVAKTVPHFYKIQPTTLSPDTLAYLNNTNNTLCFDFEKPVLDTFRHFDTCHLVVDTSELGIDLQFDPCQPNLPTELGQKSALSSLIQQTVNQMTNVHATTSVGSDMSLASLVMFIMGMLKNVKNAGNFIFARSKINEKGEVESYNTTSVRTITIGKNLYPGVQESTYNDDYVKYPHYVGALANLHPLPSYRAQFIDAAALPLGFTNTDLKIMGRRWVDSCYVMMDAVASILNYNYLQEFGRNVIDDALLEELTESLFLPYQDINGLPPNVRRPMISLRNRNALAQVYKLRTFIPGQNMRPDVIRAERLTDSFLNTKFKVLERHVSGMLMDDRILSISDMWTTLFQRDMTAMNGTFTMNISNVTTQMSRAIMPETLAQLMVCDIMAPYVNLTCPNLDYSTGVDAYHFPIEMLGAKTLFITFPNLMKFNQHFKAAIVRYLLRKYVPIYYNDNIKAFGYGVQRNGVTVRNTLNISDKIQNDVYRFTFLDPNLRRAGQTDIHRLGDMMVKYLCETYPTQQRVNIPGIAYRLEGWTAILPCSMESPTSDILSTDVYTSYSTNFSDMVRKYNASLPKNSSQMTYPISQFINGMPAVFESYSSFLMTKYVPVMAQVVRHPLLYEVYPDESQWDLIPGVVEGKPDPSSSLSMPVESLLEFIHDPSQVLTIYNGATIFMTYMGYSQTSRTQEVPDIMKFTAMLRNVDYHQMIKEYEEYVILARQYNENLAMVNSIRLKQLAINEPILRDILYKEIFPTIRSSTTAALSDFFSLPVRRGKEGQEIVLKLRPDLRALNPCPVLFQPSYNYTTKAEILPLPSVRKYITDNFNVLMDVFFQRGKLINLSKGISLSLMPTISFDFMLYHDTSDMPELVIDPLVQVSTGTRVYLTPEMEVTITYQGVPQRKTFSNVNSLIYLVRDYLSKIPNIVTCTKINISQASRLSENVRKLYFELYNSRLACLVFDKVVCIHGFKMLRSYETYQLEVEKDKGMIDMLLNASNYATFQVNSVSEEYTNYRDVMDNFPKIALPISPMRAPIMFTGPETDVTVSINPSDVLLSDYYSETLICGGATSMCTLPNKNRHVYYDKHQCLNTLARVYTLTDLVYRTVEIAYV